MEYAGAGSVKDLLTTVYNCDVVVGAAGVAVEMALALGRQVVLLQDKQSLKLDLRYLRGNGSIVETPDDSGEKENLSNVVPEQIVQALRERQKNIASERFRKTAGRSSLLTN